MFHDTVAAYVWSSGFLRRGSDGMELASRLCQYSEQGPGEFQIGFKDSSLRSAIQIHDDYYYYYYICTVCFTVLL